MHAAQWRDGLEVPAGTPLHVLGGARPVYQRHEPEKGVLYGIVAEHLETFLTEAAEKHEGGLPRYVERKSARSWIAES